MLVNRSAPPGAVVPFLAYEDVAKAIEWLCGAFGFTERLRTPPEPDGTIHHAQLAVGQGAVVLTSRPPVKREFIDSLLVHVDDVDAHCERARQFGARIVMLPGTKEFGERQYAAEDFAGNRWGFSQSVADVDPKDWGAQVADLKNPIALLPHPRLCYVEIPALDVHQSAAFYEKLVGWNIRHRETDRPSFDDNAVSGAFVTGRPPSRAPGLMPYIWVDDIGGTLAQIAPLGGEVVENAHPDTPGGDCLIATFRDPAGNLIGLYQEPL
jgi:predicted enzyme related to lactoylglutathione lyase